MTEILLTERTGGVVTVTLNRPESLNSLDLALKEALLATLPALATDTTCRAVVLAGAGRAFCVGQDLREHAASLADGTGTPLGTVVEHYNPIAMALATMPKPVVAAVRGTAAGAGAGLALLADFRVGGPRTTFVPAFARIGLAADTGLSWTLPRLVGHARATEILLLSEPVPAARGYELGLLTTLCDDDEAVLPAALELAGRLAQGPTTAYGAIKAELALAGTATLADALAQEAVAQQLTGGTADHRAATAAFVAKQEPRFTGR